MKVIGLYSLLDKRVLVTRDSARTLLPELSTAVAESDGEVTIDFAGVEGLAPSFFDEMLSVIEEALDGSIGERVNLVIANPPTELSSKFAAVGRGHGVSLQASETGDWVIHKA